MSTLTTIQGTDLITNSRANINDNFSALNSEKLETSVLDTDTTLAANSDAKIPSQKAVKAYVDGGGDISLSSKIVPTGAILPYGGASAPSNFLLCNGSAVSRTTYADLFAITSTSYGVGDGSTTFNLPNLQGRFPLGYSASAPTKVFTFSSRSSDTITITGADNHAHNELQTGQAVFYATTGSVITGLTDDTTYYAIRVAYNQLKLATSVANANAGTAITLSGDGTGTQTFTITYTARPLGQTGGEETHALTDSEMPSHAHGLGTSTQGGSGFNIQAVDTNAGAGGDGPSLAYVDGWISAAGSDTVHNNIPLFQVVNYIIKT